MSTFIVKRVRASVRRPRQAGRPPVVNRERGAAPGAGRMLS